VFTSTDTISRASRISCNNRYSFLQQLAWGLIGTTLGGWAMRYWLRGALHRPNRLIPSDVVGVPPVTITTHSGIRVHGIQTGVLAIKTAHAQLRGPVSLRFLSIIQDTHWTPLLPILTWVIEHPEGLIVIDTGERAAASNIATYITRDPVSRWFYQRNLPLFITPAEELAAQLRSLGLTPEDVQTVVLTHLHGDHAGGLGFFPQATFLVARTEYEGQLRQPFGAVASLWPPGWSPQLVDYTGPPIGLFRGSQPITKAGDLLLVPTPGHSYGHQSVILVDTDRSFFFAGDVAFSQAQLVAQGLQGIAYDVKLARTALTQTLHYTRATPTVFLPSHDPLALERLASGTPVAA
jgi:N-acyl homoserine lactone hydrolase